MSFPTGAPQIVCVAGTVNFSNPLQRSERWAPEINHIFKNRDGTLVVTTSTPRKFRFEAEYLFDDLGDTSTQTIQNLFETGEVFTFKPHIGGSSVTCKIVDLREVNDLIIRRGTKIKLRSNSLVTTIFLT